LIVFAILRLPHAVPWRVGLAYRLGQLVGINWAVPWPVHPSTTVRAPERVRLGKDTFPGDSPNCYIQAINGIEVGDRTNLGPGVGLISANHDPADNKRWIAAPPIRLGADCWLGMNAIVLPGVELGPRTIVGAGAVVTRSFPEGHCVIAGNPARVIRRLSDGASSNS
jgi:acetyltransferase-like isoleucine patch superfamily enzyme